MKLAKTYILIAITICSSLAGCNDFLDVDPRTAIVSDDFYQTPKDIYTALIAAYATLTTNGAYNEAMYLVGEVRSDNAFPNQPNYYGSVYRFEIEEFNITSLNNGTRNLWQQHYRGIVRCNIVINYGTERFPDDTDVQRYIQEARVLRALYYFNLVRVFGPVPIVLDIPVEYTDTRGHKREPYQEVYKRIFIDLTTAIKSGRLRAKQTGNNSEPIPDNNNTVGRVTVDAARALLGKAYLSMPDNVTAEQYGWPDISTGDPYNLLPSNAGSKWQAAFNVLNEIYLSGRYSLMPEYADLFKPENKHNTESIWEVEYSADQTEHLGSPFYTAHSPSTYIPNGAANSTGYIAPAIAVRGAGNCVPTGDLMDESKKWDSMWPDYDNPRRFNNALYSDKRLSSGEIIQDNITNIWLPVNNNHDFGRSAEYPYDPYTGTVWRKPYKGYSANDDFMCGKYLSPSPSVNNDSEDNWYILRYADVLLMMAEALNESDPSSNEALFYLNSVRRRAGIAPYTSVSQGISGTNEFGDNLVLDTYRKRKLAIQDERRFELAFEGHRWFDLVRSGLAIEVMNRHFENFYDAFTSNPSSTVNNYYMKRRKIIIDSKCMVFPIPSTEILVNPLLYPNEGAR